MSAIRRRKPATEYMLPEDVRKTPAGCCTKQALTLLRDYTGSP